MKENSKHRSKTEIRYQLAGWVLFVICSLFFILSALKNRDVLTLIGSIVFLIACVIFLMPLIRAHRGIDR